MSTVSISNAIALPELSAASLLRNIQDRFSVDHIYTWVGPILVAVNPFRPIPIPLDVCSFLQVSMHHAEPHPYALAAHAFRCMHSERLPQSLVISGISGASKTETAKICLEFFSEIGKSGNFKGERILVTSPILEAFGCARTALNGNSSRFGKTVKLKFDETSGKTLESATIETYLLARSRVTHTPKDERNYHIFYLLTNGLPADHRWRELLEIGNFSSEYFQYTNTRAVASHLADDVFVKQVLSAFATLRISEEVQLQIFRLVASVLWLGNVQVEPSPENLSGACRISEESRHALEICSRLIGVTTADLETAITKTQISAGRARESLAADVPVNKARAFRDAVAKAIYSRVFDFLVDVLNETLSPQDRESVELEETPVKKKARKEENPHTISIIDIFGLENFASNGLEQLCINHANEKLHSFFLASVAASEVEEHIREHVEYQNAAIPVDNTAVINAVESGVLSTLRRATFDSMLRPLDNIDYDQEFFEKLPAAPSECPDAYRKVPLQGVSRHRSFVIRHFAEDIVYDVDGFVEANKNTDSKVEQFISKIQNVAMNDLRESMVDWTQPSGTPKTNGGDPAMFRRCVVSDFVLQLDSLVANIRNSHGHWVRCIKPNDTQSPSSFNADLVFRQLQVTGMFEVLVLMASCYTSRVPYATLLKQFHTSFASVPDSEYRANLFVRELMLLLTDSNALSSLGVALSVGGSEFALGVSKVFFKPSAMSAFQQLLDTCAADASLPWRICDLVTDRVKRHRRRRAKMFLVQCGRFALMLRRQRAARKWFFAFFLRLTCILKFVRICLLPRVHQKRRDRECRAAAIIIPGLRQLASSLCLIRRRKEEGISAVWMQERLSMAVCEIDSVQFQKQSIVREAQVTVDSLRSENAQLTMRANQQISEQHAELVELRSLGRSQEERLVILENEKHDLIARFHEERTALMERLQEAVIGRSQAEHDLRCMSFERDRLARANSRLKENDITTKSASNSAPVNKMDADADDRSSSKPRYLEWLKSQTPSKK